MPTLRNVSIRPEDATSTAATASSGLSISTSQARSATPPSPSIYFNLPGALFRLAARSRCRAPPGPSHSLFGCCSPTACAHPPAACQRRSAAAGPGESLRAEQQRVRPASRRPPPPTRRRKHRGLTFLILDLRLHIFYGIGRLNLLGDRAAGL